MEVVLSSSVVDEEILETDVQLGVGTSEGSLGEVHVGLSASVVHVTLSDVDLGMVSKILETRDLTKMEVVLSSSVVNEHVLETDVELTIGTSECALGEVNVGLSSSVVHITLSNVDLCMVSEVLETRDLTKVEVVLSTSVVNEAEVVETDVHDGVWSAKGSSSKMHVRLSSSVVHVTLSNHDTGIGTEVLETRDLSEVEVVLTTSVVNESEVVETDVQLGVGTSEGSLGEVHVGLSVSVIHITLSNVDLGVVGKILETNVHYAIFTSEISSGKVDVVLTMNVPNITLTNVDLGVLTGGGEGTTMDVVLTVGVVDEKVLEGFEHAARGFVLFGYFIND